VRAAHNTNPPCLHVGRTRARRTRAAVALVLVLIAVGFGAAISLAFLQLATTRVLTSHNLLLSAQAEYLAESGLAEAGYRFSYQHVIDPNRPDDVWEGISGRRLDDSGDYCDVTVTPDPQDPLFYDVVSTAHILARSAEAFTRSVKAAFLINRGFRRALTCDGDLFIPPNVNIQGNVYATGDVQNMGSIDGNVRATGTVFNTGNITGKTTDNFPALEINPCNLNDPVTYRYEGAEYSATRITVDKLDRDDLTVPPAGNPAGVYIRYGDLMIDHDTWINGTLIVTGKLELNHEGNWIFALPDFPALVVQSDLELKRDSRLTTRGAVILRGRIVPLESLDHSQISINGPLVLLDGAGFGSAYFPPAWPGAMGAFTVTADMQRSGISGLFPPDPNTPRQVLQVDFQDR